MKQKLLEILRYVAGRNDEYCIRVADIGKRSNTNPAILRTALKCMRQHGLIEKTFLMNDDGQICGSGYIRTVDGDRLIAERFGE